MRILSVLPTPSVLAGTEMTTHLGNGALIELGHQVCLLHGEEQPPSTDVPYTAALGLPVLFDHHSKLRPRGMQAAMEELAQFLQRNSIDLVHVRIPPRAEVLRWFLERKPLVITTHVPVCPNGIRYLWKQRRACDSGIGIGCLTTGFLRCGCGTLGNERPIGALPFVRMMLGDSIFRAILRRAAATIAPSEWMRHRLIADGIPKDRVYVIAPPIETPKPERNALQDTRKPMVLFVGRLVDFKGPDLVLRAVAELHEIVEAWLVGDGPMRPRIEKLALDLGVASRVRFLGALDQAHVSECYRRASVCVVPSLCPETFGRVAAEACMHGVPVVTSRVGGLPEAVAGFPDASLVEPGDVAAIRNAIAVRLSALHGADRGGPANVPNPFSLDRHAASLIDVYSHTVERLNGVRVVRT